MVLLLSIYISTLPGRYYCSCWKERKKGWIKGNKERLLKSVLPIFPTETDCASPIVSFNRRFKQDFAMREMLVVESTCRRRVKPLASILDTPEIKQGSLLLGSLLSTCTFPSPMPPSLVCTLL